MAGGKLLGGFGVAQVEFGPHSAQQVRGHRTGTDRVDGQVVIGHLHGQGAGEPHQGVLGGGVGHPGADAAVSGHRGNVDDAAPAPLDHTGQGAFATMKGSLGDDVHLRVPLRFGHRGQRVEDDHAGIVDENVHAAGGFFRLGKCAVHGRRVPHVEDQGVDAGMDAPQRRHGFVQDFPAGEGIGNFRQVPGNISHKEGGPRFRQSLGDRESIPAGSSRNEGHLFLVGFFCGGVERHGSTPNLLEYWDGSSREPSRDCMRLIFHK